MKMKKNRILLVMKDIHTPCGQDHKSVIQASGIELLVF